MKHSETARTIIDIRSVSKSFRGGTQAVPVLKNVSLEIAEGDFMIIFGPSGCGKSTLLHLMLGLEPPNRGQIHFSNFNLYSYSEDNRSDFRKKRMGLVYQQANWIQSLTVVENVAFPLLLLGEKPSSALLKAGQLLRTLQMDAWVTYKPQELSSGQQQKVSLARALITDPPVIIADEPTGNLDYESGQQLMQLLLSLNKSGKTIVMVTHDLTYLQYAKTAMRMFDGRVIEVKKGHDIMTFAHTKVKKDGGEWAELESNYQKGQLDVADLKQGLHTSYAGTTQERKNENKGIIHTVASPIRFIRSLLSFAKQSFIETVTFGALILLYFSDTLVLNKTIRVTMNNKSGLSKFARLLSSIHTRLTQVFDRTAEGQISRMELIELSLKNLKTRKTRTMVTIGGMALGIATIVFLVSVGYGLQQLVIARVARLDEMKQADVRPQTGSRIKITDKTLADFKQISHVSMILPLISVVGRVNYQNSQSDMAVYGVTADYLKQSAIKPVKGTIFSSNSMVTSAQVSVPKGQVAGVKTSIPAGYAVGENLGNVEFTLSPQEWIRVRKSPTVDGAVLGYTKRTEGVYQGEEVVGGGYEDAVVGKAGTDEKGKPLGKWLHASVLLWEKKACEKTQGDCEEGQYVVLRDAEGLQVQKSGYFAEVHVQLKGSVDATSSVLGVSTDSSSPSNGGTLNFVDIASEAGIVKPPEVKKVEVTTTNAKEAVVNRAMLKVLGIPEDKALGKTFSTQFIVVGDLLDSKEQLQSVPISYTIIGVTPDEKTPIFYVPFMDLRSMGVTNYSQVKVIVSKDEDLGRARKQIEAMGYTTQSVADTVSQITNLFSTSRQLLALIGMVALAVASLGMFNTLTISLLERTREVGLMKVMGMKSIEVKQLFLTESMVMGFVGGVLGIVFGFIGGKMLGIFLSFFAVFKGAGFIDVSYIPLSFILIVMFLSLLVGILTGIYPAKRATKISALDALRYE